GGFLAFSFANKTTVNITAAGDQLLVVNLANPPAGLKTLNLDGSTGTNVLAEVGRLPSGVTVNATGFQSVLTDADDVFVEGLFVNRLGRLGRRDELDIWEAAERNG